jgi:hypothetical protein
MVMNEMHDFFERYKHLFDQQNWPAFAALFHEPALSVRGDGTVMAFLLMQKGRLRFIKLKPLAEGKLGRGRAWR